MPRTIPLVLLAAVLVVGAGCGERIAREESPPMDTTALQDEFMAADRRFDAEVASAAPADRGAVWAAWFAGDGRQIMPGQVLTDQESITAAMAPYFAAPGAALRWSPDLAVVSDSGDLGWTSGRYRARRDGPDGPTTSEGRYVTVWRRQPDGTLKVDLDLGVPDGT